MELSDKTKKEIAVKHATQMAYLIATVLFVLGVIVFFYLINDYKKALKKEDLSNFFDSQDDTGSLAAMICFNNRLVMEPIRSDFIRI